MDPNAIWEQHRSFIIACASGLLVYLAVGGYADGYRADARALETENVELRSTIDSLAGELAGAEGRQKGLARALENQAEPAVRRAVELEIPDAWRVEVAAEEDRSLFYASRLEDLRRLVTQARQRGMRPPDRFALPQNAPADRVAFASVRAFVASVILRALLHADIPAIEAVRPADRPAWEALDDDRVLRRIDFTLELRSGYDAFLRLVSALQDPGRFLEIRRAVVRRDPDGDGHRITLALAALSILSREEVEEAGLTEADESGGSGGGGPDWRPWSGGRRR